MGHVRHLEQARREGDVLVVTVTGDSFVNKGPGRPVFTAFMRAEMLAALAYVDWVGINEAPTAENVIAAIEPDIYVKGADYAEAEDDTTGKIVDERSTVESYGGRISFTDEITFSSSSLLNRFFDIHDPKLRAYLETQRERGIIDEVLAAFERIRDYRVLLVGDTIIDEYRYVSPMGKSPKENLIATLYRDRELFAGGVVAAANHVAAFCGQAERDRERLPPGRRADHAKEPLRGRRLPAQAVRGLLHGRQLPVGAAGTVLRPDDPRPREGLRPGHRDRFRPRPRHGPQHRGLDRKR
jgi:cytidyltransferase-like protein